LRSPTASIMKSPEAAEAQNGLCINTVPNGGTMAADDAVDTYQAVQELQRRSRVLHRRCVRPGKHAAANLGTEQGLCST
jgi:hypothetical protein